MGELAAEVISEHLAGSKGYHCNCGKQAPLGKARGWYAAHVLDALRAAGFAVVALPELITDQYGDPTVPVPLVSSLRRPGHLRIEPGGLNYQGIPLPVRIAALGVPLPLEVPDARTFAAALLAAADAAEAGNG